MSGEDKNEKIITDNQVKVVVEKSPEGSKDEVKISVIEPDSTLAQEIIVNTAPKEEKKKENKVRVKKQNLIENLFIEN